MQYRLVDQDEMAKCEALLANNEYFGPVKLSKLGGSVLAAFDGDEVVACMWMHCAGTRAYIDYICVLPEYKGAGVRLLTRCYRLLGTLGAEDVHFTVYNGDEEATKVANAFGATLSGPYAIGVVTLRKHDV